MTDVSEQVTLPFLEKLQDSAQEKIATSNPEIDN